MFDKLKMLKNKAYKLGGLKGEFGKLDELNDSVCCLS